jgi:hypothetical protein
MRKEENLTRIPILTRYFDLSSSNFLAIAISSGLAFPFHNALPNAQYVRNAWAND